MFTNLNSHMYVCFHGVHTYSVQCTSIVTQIDKDVCFDMLRDKSRYKYQHICKYVHINIYIYSDLDIDTHIYIYIYVYIYIPFSNSLLNTLSASLCHYE